MTNGSPEILDQFTYFLLQFRILGQIRPKNDQKPPKTLKNHLSPAFRCYCSYSDVPEALGWLATWFWDDLDRFCHLIATKSPNFRKFASPDANLRQNLRHLSHFQCFSHNCSQNRRGTVTVDPAQPNLSGRTFLTRF